MAAQIVKDIQTAGGFITLTDLSGYRAIERGPLRTKVKGLELLTTPPPGSGALISLALKIMAGMCIDSFYFAEERKAILCLCGAASTCGPTLDFKHCLNFIRPLESLY